MFDPASDDRRMDDGGTSREGRKKRTTKLGVGGIGGNALGIPTPGASGAPKKRKANASKKSESTPPPKKRTLPPSFSMAAISMRLDGTEAHGVPSAEFVGNPFRRGRKDGLLLYYVDKAPGEHPLEYESKIAGASSMDWSMMRKDLKVDALCMETFKWYGAKVAEVSLERRQVKVSCARVVGVAGSTDLAGESIPRLKNARRSLVEDIRVAQEIPEHPRLGSQYVP